MTVGLVGFSMGRWVPVNSSLLQAVGVACRIVAFVAISPNFDKKTLIGVTKWRLYFGSIRVSESFIRLLLIPQLSACHWWLVSRQKCSAGKPTFSDDDDYHDGWNERKNTSRGWNRTPDPRVIKQMSIRLCHSGMVWAVRVWRGVHGHATFHRKIMHPSVEWQQ